MKKQVAEWIAWGKEKKRFIIFYEENVFDITDFVNFHPGGKKVLDSYIYKDVTQSLFTIYPHRRQTTVVLLNKYIIGVNTSNENKRKGLRENSRSLAKGSRQKKRVCFSKTVVNSPQTYGINRENSSNSIERSGYRQKKPPKLSYYAQPKSKNTPIDRFEVSIKLINDPVLEEKILNSHKGHQLEKYSEIDLNVKQQEMNEENTIANIRVFKANLMKKQ